MCGLFASECTCLFAPFFNKPKSQFPVAKLPSLGTRVMGSAEGQIISDLSLRPHALLKYPHTLTRTYHQTHKKKGDTQAYNCLFESSESAHSRAEVTSVCKGPFDGDLYLDPCFAHRVIKLASMKGAIESHSVIKPCCSGATGAGWAGGLPLRGQLVQPLLLRLVISVATRSSHDFMSEKRTC